MFSINITDFQMSSLLQSSKFPADDSSDNEIPSPKFQALSIDCEDGFESAPTSPSTSHRPVDMADYPAPLEAISAEAGEIVDDTDQISGAGDEPDVVEGPHVNPYSNDGLHYEIVSDPEHPLNISYRRVLKVPCNRSELTFYSIDHLWLYIEAIQRCLPGVAAQLLNIKFDDSSQVTRLREALKWLVCPTWEHLAGEVLTTIFKTCQHEDFNHALHRDFPDNNGTFTSAGSDLRWTSGVSEDRLLQTACKDFPGRDEYGIRLYDVRTQNRIDYHIPHLYGENNLSAFCAEPQLQHKDCNIMILADSVGSHFRSILTGHVNFHHNAYIRDVARLSRRFNVLGTRVILVILGNNNFKQPRNAWQEEFQVAARTFEHVKEKVVWVSVLPRENHRTDELNEFLRSSCEAEGYHFIRLADDCLKYEDPESGRFCVDRRFFRAPAVLNSEGTKRLISEISQHFVYLGQFPITLTDEIQFAPRFWRNPACSGTCGNSADPFWKDYMRPSGNPPKRLGASLASAVDQQPNKALRHVEASSVPSTSTAPPPPARSVVANPGTLPVVNIFNPAAIPPMPAPPVGQPILSNQPCSSTALPPSTPLRTLRRVTITFLDIGDGYLHPLEPLPMPIGDAVQGI